MVNIGPFKYTAKQKCVSIIFTMQQCTTVGHKIINFSCEAVCFLLHIWVPDATISSSTAPTIWLILNQSICFARLWYCILVPIAEHMVHRWEERCKLVGGRSNEAKQSQLVVFWWKMENLRYWNQINHVNLYGQTKYFQICTNINNDYLPFSSNTQPVDAFKSA